MDKNTDKWSFSESFIWSNKYPQCGAKNQSPININTDNVQMCKTLCDFSLHYKPSKCRIVYNNNLVKINYDTGSYLEYKNILYELKEINIHVPTLHSIDNSKYDLEVSFIHNLSSENTTNTNSSTPTGIILTRLYESGPHYGGTETFINQIINDIPKEQSDFETEISVSEDWGAELCLPENRSYFMYDGSLPYPPCDTNYKVIVFEDIGNIGRTNLEILKLNIGSNVREVQEIGNRMIMYKAYYKDEEKKNILKNSVKVDDKFLKCKKNPIAELIPKVEEIIKTTMTVTVGLDDETKLFLKQLFLALILIFILATAFVFVKYLFNHFMAQKILIMLIGNQYLEGWIEKWDNCTRNSNEKTQKKIDKIKKGISTSTKSDTSSISGLRR